VKFQAYDDARVVIYDRNRFIIKATDQRSVLSETSFSYFQTSEVPRS
jgi:hypothetical protein